GDAATGVIQKWDGNAWTLVSAPSTTTAQFNELHGVTCSISNSQCLAVGESDGEFTLADRWDGTSWSIVSSASSSSGGLDNVLYRVGCSSGSDCWAAGENFYGDLFFQHWDGN